jgi:hypothetical protein
MRIKILFGLAMLFTLTASLSAQTAEMITFGYQNNVSEQIFIEVNSAITQKSSGILVTINKLPTPVIQAINNNLRDYTLDIGDMFIALVMYQNIGYHVSIRITDAKKINWQFYAWRKY